MIGVQLRCSFRLYPSAGQRSALARVFGCARVVYNDALRARETARTEGTPFPKTGDLSKQLITEAKNTLERAWLGEVSAVVLQQSLRDLDTAYRNFFDGLKGKRPRVGAPRCKPRKDTRQAVRFTANARWSITAGGKLRLPKIGDLKVKWSRSLLSTPSTVTVVKDSAGRYFASFVVETGPEEVLPEATPEVGIDLGLGHFAVLSDGTKIDSPRFLRRAEKRLKKAQRDLSRKVKGSNNRDKARIKVARAHAGVADARREFHHQLSTKLIRENQDASAMSAANQVRSSRISASATARRWKWMLTATSPRFGGPPPGRTPRTYSTSQTTTVPETSACRRGVRRPAPGKRSPRPGGVAA